MNIAVIFAGGVGKRMHSKELPKQFLEINGKPVIIHTLDRFEACDEIDAVVISCIGEWTDHLKRLLFQYRIEKVKRIVQGGETGQLSIYNGLLAAEEISAGEESVVLIHDGVRPLIDVDLIRRNIECVRKNGSAITTASVTETLLMIDERSGAIEQVPERRVSRTAKAPQSFWLRDVLSVHRQAMADGKTDFIDTCTLMYSYGKTMHLIDCSEENIKITTREDFYLMRAMLELKENEQLYTFEDN